MNTDSLLLSELEGGEKIDSLQLPKVDVVPQQEDEDKLDDVLALRLPINSLLVTCHM